ncbi:hypothetical protein ACHAPO_008762 [Fusarium lateritium]
MAPEVPSNIRVFIRWHDQTVFAGEEVKCTITFKNRDLKDHIAVMGALRVYRYFLERKANFRLDLILVDYSCPLPSLLANQQQPLSLLTVFRAHHYSTLHILHLTDLAEYLVRRQILKPL